MRIALPLTAITVAILGTLLYWSFKDPRVAGEFYTYGSPVMAGLVTFVMFYFIDKFVANKERPMRVLFAITLVLSVFIFQSIFRECFNDWHGDAWHQDRTG